MKVFSNGCAMGWAVLALLVVASTADVRWRCEVKPFSEAELFLEENTTDGDLGLHMKVDGEGWRRVLLIGPNHRRLLDVKVKDPVRYRGRRLERFKLNSNRAAALSCRGWAPYLPRFPREAALPRPTRLTVAAEAGYWSGHGFH